MGIRQSLFRNRQALSPLSSEPGAHRGQIWNAGPDRTGDSTGGDQGETDPGSPGVVRRQEDQDWLERPMRLIVTSADPADPAAGAAGTLKNIGWGDESGAIRAANVSHHLSIARRGISAPRASYAVAAGDPRLPATSAYQCRRERSR